MSAVRPVSTVKGSFDLSPCFATAPIFWGGRKLVSDFYSGSIRSAILVLVWGVP